MSGANLLGFVLGRLPAPGEKNELERVAKGARVSYHTLLKIANGETEDPKISTVQKLYDYFRSPGSRKAA